MIDYIIFFASMNACLDISVVTSFLTSVKIYPSVFYAWLTFDQRPLLSIVLVVRSVYCGCVIDRTANYRCAVTKTLQNIHFTSVSCFFIVPMLGVDKWNIGLAAIYIQDHYSYCNDQQHDMECGLADYFAFACSICI